MMRLSMLALVALAALAGASCNPYDPDLGQTPFFCADNPPSCPEGYGESFNGSGQCVCTKAAGPFECNADPREPNNEVLSATETPVAAISTSTSFLGNAVCPTTDLDYFHLSAPTANIRFDVTLTGYDVSRPAPTLEIVNGADTQVALGAESAGSVAVSYKATFSTDLYIKISGTAEANYDLAISSVQQ